MSQKPRDSFECQQCPDRQRVRELERLLVVAPVQQATNSAMDAMRELRSIMSSPLNAFEKCDRVREVLAQHQ
jgi:hypothetical protein